MCVLVTEPIASRLGCRVDLFDVRELNHSAVVLPLGGETGNTKHSVADIPGASVMGFDEADQVGSGGHGVSPFRCTLYTRPLRTAQELFLHPAHFCLARPATPRYIGTMQLAEYLEREGLTLQEFADRIDRHESTVSRIARGLVFPDRDTLLAIQRATKGKVAVRDFYLE